MRRMLVTFVCYSCLVRKLGQRMHVHIVSTDINPEVCDSSCYSQMRRPSAETNLHHFSSSLHLDITAPGTQQLSRL